MAQVMRRLTAPKAADRSVTRAAIQGTELVLGDGSLPRRTRAHRSRQVAAETIRRLCVGEGGLGVHERGVALCGAWIVGRLDLAGAVVARPLALVNCLLDAAPVFSAATIRSLRLSGSAMPGLQADQLECKGNLVLDGGFQADGTVSITGATIGGQLTCSGTFRGTAGETLSAQGLDCRGGIFLSDSLVENGSVNLAQAKVGVTVQCSTIKLRHPGATALNAQGLECPGSIVLSPAFSAEGEVNLARASLGLLSCGGAELTNPQGYALNLEGVVCRGDVSLHDGFLATGVVSLAGATVSGQVNCGAGHFMNPTGDALSAQGLACQGDVFLRTGFRAEGAVSLAGATVRGQVSCAGGAFAGRLTLYGAHLTGQFFWSDIHAAEATSLSLDGAHAATLVTDAASEPGR